ncbi:hypothetical protein KO361_00480 [Candidatus Woesearchaeota archaeon]|nr:hypothetical protein [Candidatus Woesearchaeota archaeon]
MKKESKKNTTLNKNKQITLTLIILSLIILFTTTTNAQTNLEDCNAEGGIWCVTSGTNGFCTQGGDDVTCKVSTSQNVTLSQTQGVYNSNNPKIFDFNELIIEENIILQFFNAPYSNNVLYSATSANEPSSVRRTGAWYKSPNTLSASRGGSGGRGGVGGNEDNRFGGGGAAGAAGGKIGIHGGTASGFSGSIGSRWRGTQAGNGYIGGKAGGFVVLNLNKLVLNGIISVDGEDGRDGQDGADTSGSRRYGGQGGGPGSGGGGAGEIKINLADISTGSQGKITAIGGAGGSGGKGGSGNGDRFGGGGGAGGGGAGGIILFSFTGENPDLFQLPPNFCEGGSSGSPGDPGADRGGALPGTVGLGGPGGICNQQVLEWNPDNIPGLTDEQKRMMMYEYCNTGGTNADSDGDGLPDMADPDCYGMNHQDQAAFFMGWDSSIRTYYPNINNYPDTDIAWFNPSASDGNDLVCGDNKLRIGSCSCSVTTYNENQFNSCSYDQYAGYDYGCATDMSCYGDSYCVPNGCAPGSPPFCSVDYNNECVFSEYDASEYCFDKDETECINDWYCEPIYGVYNTETKSFPHVFSSAECNGASIPGTNTNSCNWNTQNIEYNDLGYITPDGLFVCLDNSRNFVKLEGGLRNEPPVSAPFRNYTWREASLHPGILMYGYDTMFVSNYEEWFYCDPYNEGKFGENNISLFNTFPSPDSLTNPMCTDTIFSFNFFSNVEDCDYEVGEIAECYEEYYDASEGFVFCPKSSDGEILRHDLGASDEFRDQCGLCEVKIGEDEWTSLFNYLQSLANEDLEHYCIRFPYDPICDEETGASGEGDSNIIPQDDCISPENCLGDSIDTTISCEAIHLSLNFNYPSSDDTKVCDLNTQYCRNGELVNSDDGACCLGQNAYCENFEQGMCLEIGGKIYSEQANEICLGVTIGTDCCLGRVTLSPETILASYVRNQSYICYQDVGKGFFKECCGSVTGCFNENNNMLTKRYVLSRYVMDGGPTHSLIHFDTVNIRGLLQVLGHANNKYDNANHLGFALSSVGYDLTNFDYLQFDFATNNKDFLKDLVIVDTQGKNISFDLNELITVDNKRWQHVIINLNQGHAITQPGFSEGIIKGDEEQIDFVPMDGSSTSTNEFDRTKAYKIVLTFDIPQGSTIDFLIDNVFLRSYSDNNLDINSEPRFCSGNWGTWLENLDGPNADNDSGFFEGFEPRSEDMIINEYGPYMDGCNGVISYGWTGSACCGDDTLPDNEGEYWVDREGICWNGKTVRHDDTIANTITKNYGTESIQEKGLLFFGGEPILCEVNPDQYDDINFIFDGETNEEYTFKDALENAEIVEPFTIRGRWICQRDEGWIKIDDFNRVSLMAAFMLEIVNKSTTKNLFTISCGDMEKTINYDEPVNKDLLGSFCLLRRGSNNNLIGLPPGLEVSGDIYVAFESKNLRDPIVNNLDSILNFPALAGYTWDCSNVPTNPNHNEFFTKCESNENKPMLYYNKPFNMFILSYKNLEQGFFARMWDSLVNFFKKLFGTIETDVTSINLNLLNFTEYKDTSEVFISKQNNRSIIGKSEDIGGIKKIRVEYNNLTSNVAFLVDMIKTKYNVENALWIPQNYTQIIFVEIRGSQRENLKLNELTSLLRLKDIPDASVDFGLGRNCSIRIDDEDSNWFSGTKNYVYLQKEANNPDLCGEAILLECADGELSSEENEFYSNCIQKHEVSLFKKLDENKELISTQFIEENSEFSHNIKLYEEQNDVWHAFVNWTNDEKFYENTQLNFVINQNINITMNYLSNPDLKKLTIETEPWFGGEVILNQEQDMSHYKLSETNGYLELILPEGFEVNLSAQGKNNHEFSHWWIDSNAYAYSPYTFNMPSQNKVIGAVFIEN